MPDQTPSMPPLPEPDTHCYDEDTGTDVWSHSPAQVIAYAQAVADERVREALEQAVKACLSEAVEVVVTSDWAYNNATQHCAEAIRALIPTLSLERKDADHG